MRKKCRIMLIPWPPEKLDKIKPNSNIPPVSDDELSDSCHREITALFPEYQTLLRDMVNRLPIETIITNISNKKLPDFIRRLFMLRLKNGNDKQEKGGTNNEL
jgi:hypothetical protein